MGRYLIRWSGGRVPFGYRLAPDGRRLERHEAEQLVVAQIRRWRRSDKSWHAIARSLTAGGIPTKAGKSKWHASQVRKIYLADHRLRGLASK